MIRLPGFRLLHAARLVAFAMAALALPQVSHAAESYALGDTSCGQLGQPACTIVTYEWLRNANGTGCDRGLDSAWRESENRYYCVDGSRKSATVNSWTANALRMQRELQANLPLNQLAVLGAHNAFNNTSDGYAYPNQTYSITDQLNMGIRLLSVDTHWVVDDLRLCHGKNDWKPFAGCSPADRPYYQIIEELNQWMRRAENSQEVVFLELEAYIRDGDGQLRIEELAQPIREHLADLVFRPSMMPANGLPTLNDIRATGKRLIILNGDDYGQDLFIRLADEGRGALEAAYVNNFTYSPCGYVLNGALTAFDPTYANTTRRTVVYEDSLVFGIPDIYLIIYDGPAEVGTITPEKLRQLAACHITSVSMDKVTSEKLQDAVWSWDVSEPNNQNNEDCAEMVSTGRWRDTSCSEVRQFACRNSYNPADWRVTTGADAWQQGASQCASEYPGYTFAVPRTGYENQKLAEAAQGQSVWLNHNDIAAEGVWGNAPSPASTVQLRSLGKCLDLAYSNINNGSNIVLWQCNGGTNQRWVLPGDGTIRSALDTSKCLDLANSNTTNGSNIVLWDCHGGNNQRWIVDGPFLRSALNQNKVIDVAGGNTANGTRILLWDYHGTANQQWTQVQP